MDTENGKKDLTITILTGLMMCLVIIATFALKINSPMGGGILTLADALILFTVIILGKGRAFISAAAGTAIGYLLAGATPFVIWAAIIKAIMAIAMGVFLDLTLKATKENKKILGVPLLVLISMAVAEAIMLIGFVVANGVIAGKVTAALASILPYLGQGVACIILGFILVVIFNLSPLGKMFKYTWE